MPEILRIERPAMGDTYSINWYGIYRYTLYPEGHPLAGQGQRRCRGIYRSLREAQRSFPSVEWTGPEQGGWQDPLAPGPLPRWLNPDAVVELWEGRAGG